MFSIVDIQTEQETEFEDGEESAEADEDQPIHSYPIRCSLSITKVRYRRECELFLFFFVLKPLLFFCIGLKPGCSEHRRDVPGWSFHHGQHLVLP